MPPRKRKTDQTETVQKESPEIRYFNRSSISESLICSVCQEVFTKPMRISCGHTFCEGCLEDWMRVCRHDQSTCPTCRQGIIVAATHRDLLALDFLEREEVFCSHGGCDWIGKLSSLTGHMEGCEHHPKNIPDWVDPSQTDGGPTSAFRRRLYAKEAASGSAVSAASAFIYLSDSEVDLTD